MKIALLILDGYGLRASTEGNALLARPLPALDALLASSPAVAVTAPGDSLLGHLSIGTGQPDQHLLFYLERDIVSGLFFHNPSLTAAMRRVKERGGKLHLVGTLAAGDGHASRQVLSALLTMARQQEVAGKVYLHLIIAGSDSGQRRGQALLADLQNELKALHYGGVATLIGAFYGHDRDHNLDRTNAAWQLMTAGLGRQAMTPMEGIVDAYAAGASDYRLPPTVISRVGLIADGDSIIFFNHRPDGLRQLVEVAALANISHTFIVGMTRYYNPFPFSVAYEWPLVNETLGGALAAAGRRVLKITETERYAHLTSFFNGGREEPYNNEERDFVPSLKTPTVERAPDLAIKELTAKVKAALPCESDLLVVNVPNLDTVGHTGDEEATARAAVAVDGFMAAVVAAAGERCLIVTADHGLAERPVGGDIATTVPVIFHHPTFSGRPAGGSYQRLAAAPPAGRLADLPGTILRLMNIPVPTALAGADLFELAGQP